MAQKGDPLRRDTPVPLYYQLQQILMKQIESGSPGDALASETELVAQYGVSRITVRRALNELAREGYIVRQQGKGNFVAEKTAGRRPEKMRGFLEELKKRGYKIGSRTLQSGHRRVTPRVAAIFGLDSEESAYAIRRIGFVEDEPIGISDIWLALGPDFELSAEALARGDTMPLHTFVDSIFLSWSGKRVIAGERALAASLTTAEEAELLDVEPGFPILLSEVIMCAHDNQALAYVKARYRGDRYVYKVKLYK